jgi:Ca2+:H+ antiporter
MSDNDDFGGGAAQNPRLVEKSLSRFKSLPEPAVSSETHSALRASQSMQDDSSQRPNKLGATSTMVTAYAATKFMRTMRKESRDYTNKAILSTGDRGASYQALEGIKERAIDHSNHNHWKSSLIAIYHMIIEKKLNLMLLLIPFACLSPVFGWSDTVIFILNFLAMMPLASLLGEFTEEVALHTNQTIGGLVNATFGNAVEVVVALQALAANQIRVVQASLMGSVFSNMLLVLGCCFFFGGIKHKEQQFNSTSAVANMSLLMLSSLAIVLPTPLADANEVSDVLMISRFVGVCLLFMYAQLMFFQLKSHAHLYEDEEEEEIEAELSMPAACLGLLVITLSVAYLSDLLVASIDGFTEEANLSKTFVGLILLPIIGNAVEHVTAVTVAMKDKMELAIGVAIGSATQISMLVTPVVVLAGWIMDKEMTLAFPDEEVILYVLSVIIVATASTAGRSNWLLGSLLITTYVLISLAFWYEKVEEDGTA